MTVAVPPRGHTVGHEGPLGHARRHLAGGALWSTLAEGLVLPTGLITAAYLTRRLGPEGYGLFTLAATVLGWLAWTTTSLLPYRAVIKLLNEADDWRRVGASVLRLHLWFGLAAAALLALAAAPVAALLGQPELTPYLQLLALEALLFNLAQAHRKVATGLGLFGYQAGASAARWIARLLLIVGLVELGWSVTGAVLGSATAVLVELVIYRCRLRPAVSARYDVPVGFLVRYVGPLFLFALCFQLASRIDLLALTALGGTAAQAGLYGAAQNLSLIPGILVAGAVPLVIASVSRLSVAGHEEAARQLARDALRAAVALFPFAAMTAGAADEIVVWIFGPAFAPAGPLLAVLIFGAVAAVMILVATLVPVAADRPGWTVAVAAPVVLLAVAGHLALIPRYGPIGAATATTAAAALGALAALAVAFRLWRIAPGPGTVARTVVLCALAYAAAAWWSTPGAAVLGKLLAIALAVPFGYWALGEFGAAEVAAARALLRERPAPAPGQSVTAEGKRGG